MCFAHVPKIVAPIRRSIFIGENGTSPEDGLKIWSWLLSVICPQAEGPAGRRPTIATTSSHRCIRDYWQSQRTSPALENRCVGFSDPLIRKPLVFTVFPTSQPPAFKVASVLLRFSG
ncbi:hypothetical protein MSAN_00115600 [Mycena sanguinolenta]|uniref:Uncharacterized protein n=1 Tax=Mycena sanguinolenta TaxID=230812 RepID=A0A8H7DKQ5_9AGAR|nr:hypothetical protein MSAN_00115600 [Mycena sanguinolenta]